MFKNYFTIAWRNLIKTKGYSFINIGGLALGMSVALIIGLWVNDELSFNKYHDNYDQIAQVMKAGTLRENIIQVKTIFSTRCYMSFRQPTVRISSMSSRAKESLKPFFL